MNVKLRLSQRDHELLRRHLLPGDGLEAVAVALCGRRRSRSTHCLTVRSVTPIPYDECKERKADRVTWSTKRLIPLLEEAEKRDLGILKIHSHPGGYPEFSTTDDDSDNDLFNSVFGWTDSKFPHASAVMLPDGRMFGRAILRDGRFPGARFYPCARRRHQILDTWLWRQAAWLYATPFSTFWGRDHTKAARYVSGCDRVLGNRQSGRRTACAVGSRAPCPRRSRPCGRKESEPDFERVPRRCLSQAP